MTNFKNFDLKIKDVKIIRSASKWEIKEPGFLVLTRSNISDSEAIFVNKGYIVIKKGVFDSAADFTYNFIVFDVPYNSFKNDDERLEFIYNLLDLQLEDRNQLTALMILQSKQMKKEENIDSYLSLGYQGLHQPIELMASNIHGITNYLFLNCRYATAPWVAMVIFKNLKFSDREYFIPPSYLQDMPLLKWEDGIVKLVANIVHKVSSTSVFLILRERASVVEFKHNGRRWEAVLSSRDIWIQDINQDFDILETELLPAIVRNQGTYSDLKTLLEITGWKK